MTDDERKLILTLTAAVAGLCEERRDDTVMFLNEAGPYHLTGHTVAKMLRDAARPLMPKASVPADERGTTNVEREVSPFTIGLEEFAKDWKHLVRHDRDAAHILAEISIILKRREEWGAALVSS